jgi:hypothetical protein
MDEIDRRFNEDKPALATYNLKDCELVTQIFHKTEIMPFLLERATVNGLAATGTAAPWRPLATSIFPGCTGRDTSPQPRGRAAAGQPRRLCDGFPTRIV